MENANPQDERQDESMGKKRNPCLVSFFNRGGKDSCGAKSLAKRRVKETIGRTPTGTDAALPYSRFLALLKTIIISKTK